MIAGKMKDETGGIVVEEFVKLKPKYTFWQIIIASIKKKQMMWIKMLL